MTYAIIGAGIVGATLAASSARRIFPSSSRIRAAPKPSVNSPPNSAASIKAVAVDEAVKADIIFVAVGALAFKAVGGLLQDWSVRIVIDVTNAFMLPPEVQRAEYPGRFTSEVHAERVPGAKLGKAFNQLPFKVLASPLSDDVGRRNTRCRIGDRIGSATEPPPDLAGKDDFE